MDYYEITMKGKFWSEMLTSSPVYEASHEGRLYYNTTEKMLYNATNAAWVPVGIPKDTKMLFYQDTAPTGWTIVTTVDDTLVYFTKGSSGGGNAGGALKTASTWTQPSHTHSVTTGTHTHTIGNHFHGSGSHTHTTTGTTLTTAQIPAHTHTVSINVGAGGSGGGMYYAQGIHSVWNYTSAANTGGGGSHDHGTTSAGSGNTEGTTLTSDAGGTGTVTSATGATASSWRPSGYCVIICTKN